MRGSDDKESQVRVRETFSGLPDLAVFRVLVLRLTGGISIGVRILPLGVECHRCIVKLFLG